MKNLLKKRILFVLHYNQEKYMLSRNFSLQEVGDIDWIKKNYNFESISSAVDELVVLNVERENKNMKTFAKNLSILTQRCFIPVAAGGGIRNIKDAKLILNSGADKLVVNSILFEDKLLVKSLIKKYGSQCIVASIDYKEVQHKRIVFIKNGTISTNIELKDAIKNCLDLNVGEILLNSIEQDGTGMGYDLETLREVVTLSTVPIIAAGGAGKYSHFKEAMEVSKVTAVSTANLFYFMSDGIKDARQKLIEENIDLAKWDKDLSFITNKKI